MVCYEAAHGGIGTIAGQGSVDRFSSASAPRAILHKGGSLWEGLAVRKWEDFKYKCSGPQFPLLWQHQPFLLYHVDDQSGNIQ